MVYRITLGYGPGWIEWRIPPILWSSIHTICTTYLLRPGSPVRQKALPQEPSSSSSYCVYCQHLKFSIRPTYNMEHCRNSLVVQQKRKLLFHQRFVSRIYFSFFFFFTYKVIDFLAGALFPFTWASKPYTVSTSTRVVSKCDVQALRGYL